MITCPKCSKENQDHYKFCLGCGAELPREVAPKKFAADTPPHGVPAVKVPAPGAGIVDETTNMGPGPQPALRARPPSVPAPAPSPAPGAAPAAAPAAAGGLVTCPQCEHPNPPNNKFCASCGFKLTRPAAAAAEPAPAPAAATGSTALSNVVLTALRADGTEAGSYTLPAGIITVGRDTGAIFAGDSYLSPRHATFTPRGGKLYVKDEGSLNGIYKKLRREEPILIRPGDVFRIGQEILRYEPLAPLSPTSDGVERLGSPSKGYIGRIALVIGRDATGNAFPLPESGLHLGRERGDVLFPEDGYVSGLHCRIAVQAGQVYVTDLGSSNGTFVRLLGETDVGNGDILLMGQQLFRIAM